MARSFAWIEILFFFCFFFYGRKIEILVDEIEKKRLWMHPNSNEWKIEPHWQHWTQDDSFQKTKKRKKKKKIQNGLRAKRIHAHFHWSEVISTHVGRVQSPQIHMHALTWTTLNIFNFKHTSMKAEKVISDFVLYNYLLYAID